MSTLLKHRCVNPNSICLASIAPETHLLCRGHFSCPHVASSSQQTPVPLIVGHASCSHVVHHEVFGVSPRIFPSDGTSDMILDLLNNVARNLERDPLFSWRNDPCLTPLSALVRSRRGICGNEHPDGYPDRRAGVSPSRSYR